MPARKQKEEEKTMKPKKTKKGSNMRIAYILGRIRTQILALVLLLFYVNRSLYHCAILVLLVKCIGLIDYLTKAYSFTLWEGKGEGLGEGLGERCMCKVGRSVSEYRKIWTSGSKNGLSYVCRRIIHHIYSK